MGEAMPSLSRAPAQSRRRSIIPGQENENEDDYDEEDDEYSKYVLRGLATSSNKALWKTISKNNSARCTARNCIMSAQERVERDALNP